MKNVFKIMLVLLVTLLFVVSCVPEEGTDESALAGEAIKGGKFADIKNDATCEAGGYDFYIKTKYTYANGVKFQEPNEACCVPEKQIWKVDDELRSNTCFSPSTNECYSENELHSNGVYLCSKGDKNGGTWVKCTEGGKGKLATNAHIINNKESWEKGVEWSSENNLICDGKKWTECTADTKYATFEKSYCNGEKWVKLSNKAKTDHLILSDTMTYTKTTEKKGKKTKECFLWVWPCYTHQAKKTINVNSWVQANFALDSPVRAEYCSKADQCVTSSGACKKYDAFYTNTWICGNDNDFLKCDSNAQGIISDGGRYICNKNKWTIGKENQKIDGFTKISGKWIDTTVCKNLKSGQKCIFSDVVVKWDNNGKSHSITEAAIKSERIGVGKSTQCIAKGHKAYDFGAVAGGKVCGNDNNWLLCYKDVWGIVSDDGNYVCNGNVWKKIKNTKGACSSCTAKETCLGSNLNSEGGSVKYWNTNRIGCSTDPSGCVDKSGSDFNYGDVTLNKFLCYNNNWQTCDQKKIKLNKIISPDRSHVCVYKSNIKKYVWNECDKLGEMSNNGKTVCTQEGWYTGKSGKTHLASEFAEYLFDGDHWNTCKEGGDNEGVIFAGNKCENGKWTFLYVDPSSVTGGKVPTKMPTPKTVGSGSGSSDTGDDTGTGSRVAPSGRRSR